MNNTALGTMSSGRVRLLWSAPALRRAGQVTLPSGSPVSPAMMGSSCGAWSVLSQDAKLVAVSNWGASHGYSLTTAQVIQISANLDSFCSQLQFPGLADVASNSCAVWNAFSVSQKTTLVQQWMQNLMSSLGFNPTIAGVAIPVVAAADVASAVSALNGCSATIAATSIAVCLLGQPSDMPSDLSVTLDGNPMPPTTTGCYSTAGVDATVPHHVIVTGTGIVTQMRTVNAVSGSGQMVTVPLQPAVGSVMVSVSVASGTFPSDAAVSLDGAPLPYVNAPLGGTPGWNAASVQPGSHIITVTGTGFVTQTQTVSVAVGQASNVAVSLAPVVVLPPPAVAGPPASSGPPANSNAPPSSDIAPSAAAPNWIPWIIGGAVVVGLIYWSSTTGSSQPKTTRRRGSSSRRRSLQQAATVR
jgi:hypothetical protein